MSFPDWCNSLNRTISGFIDFPANGIASSFFMAEKSFDPSCFAMHLPIPCEPDVYSGLASNLQPPTSPMNAEAVSSTRLNGTASLGSPLRCLHLCLLGRGPKNPAGSEAVFREEKEPVLGLLLRQLSPWTIGTSVPRGNPGKWHKIRESGLSHLKSKRAGEFVKVTGGDWLLGLVVWCAGFVYKQVAQSPITYTLYTRRLQTVSMLKVLPY